MFGLLLLKYKLGYSVGNIYRCNGREFFCYR